MAFNWEEAFRKAETVEFSAETTDGFPTFARDGFGSVFKFVSAGAFVKYEKVDEPCCFKLFAPDMTVRNVARELMDKVANGEVKK
jgi:hypothetical protein